MARSYLRMLVSSPHELPFVRMNIVESQSHVDTVLVCEANRTHTGEPRELIYQELLSTLESDLLSAVKYVPMDLAQTARPYEGRSDLLHRNEQLIRDGFTDVVSLNKDDIVFAVDADEVLFSRSYPALFRALTLSPLAPSCLSLKLYQYAFRLNYYWAGRTWRAPVACRAGFFLDAERAQWRYRGWRWPTPVGTHFAWVMSADDMAAKIMRYSHRVELEHLADPEILSRAVEDKRYVFDENVDFRVKELREFDSRTQPRSLLDVAGTHPELLSAKWGASA